MSVLDTGTVTGTGAGTFTDNTKSWTASEYVGDIAKNTTLNKSARITANTSDTITADLDISSSHTFSIIAMADDDLWDWDGKKPKPLEKKVLGMDAESPVKPEFGVD